MARVAKATLRTDSWDKVYTEVKKAETHTYSAMNSALVESVGYPIVIVSPPTVSFDKLSMQGGYTSSTIALMIECYDDNAQDVKTLTDSVTNALLANRKLFAGDGLGKMEMDEGDYDFWEEGKKKIHRITFNVSFQFIGE